MEKIKIGMVGLGQRGETLLNALLAVDDAQVVAVCDLYADRCEKAAKTVKEKRGHAPRVYADFKEMLADKDVRVTFICSSWEAHIEQAILNMRAGKITAMEVGGASNLQECYDLVSAYEETHTPFMMLENCCYDRFELLSTALTRKGVLGEIVHCHGAYSHDLRDEILGGNVHRHYRLKHYQNRNCENYPTHELGPIAKLLGVNRGNRMVKLYSAASKAAGLTAFSYSDKNPDLTLRGQQFAQGDIVNTLITCENGETVSLTLDTTLPKYYSREFTVRGTKGLTNQEANMIFLEGKHDSHEFFDVEKTIEKYLNNANEYKEYLPDYWKNITEKERELGHGGMDYFMCREFIHAVQSGAEMPIDVYDAAAWASVTPLSEESIRTGLAVDMPDFTRGAYKTRPLKDVVPL